MNNKNLNRSEDILCLFDVDGTLTLPRKCMSQQMEKVLSDLRCKVKVGVVGGSDLSKILEQMGSNIDVINTLDYVFAENGLVAYKDGTLIGKQNMVKTLGENLVQRVINFALLYMSHLTLPCKRGTFVELRSGLINLCPVGRSCSYDERLEFHEYDKIHKVRDKFVSVLKAEFAGCNLDFVIGGQISIDVYPTGWDKTYCLSYLDKDNFNEIHFFGDKTSEGGNDFSIFMDSRTIGHSVSCPEDTIRIIDDLFMNNVSSQ